MLAISTAASIHMIGAILYICPFPKSVNELVEWCNGNEPSLYRLLYIHGERASDHFQYILEKYSKYDVNVVSTSLWYFKYKNKKLDKQITLALNMCIYGNPQCRSVAIHFLGETGTKDECSLLACFLFGKGREELQIAVEAASAISKIGSSNEVLVFTAWLNDPSNKASVIRDHIIECRDRLSKRLSNKK